MAEPGFHHPNGTSRGGPTRVGQGVPLTWNSWQGGCERHGLGEGSRWGPGLLTWRGLEEAKFLPALLQACVVPLGVILISRAGGPVDELQAE